MSEVVFLDCDAPGCTKASREEDAKNWYSFSVAWGTHDGDNDDLQEGLGHACCLEHVSPALMDIIASADV